MRVVFVGAGPGAADLLTLRGAAAIGRADIVIWAASLVHPDVLGHAREGARIVDSAALTLEQTLDLYREAHRDGLTVARVHSGDPALWGALAEQLTACREIGLETEVIPGVSSFTAAAAAVQQELTVPEVAQSVILTRLEGGKTPMPPGESIREFAKHGTTMAVFLSAARSGQLAAELLAGGYPPQTPVVVAYRVTWPEELILRCAIDTLEATVKQHRLWKHTLFLIGPALAEATTRSHLYHPGHFHGYRKADPQARRALREPDLPRTAKMRPQALRTGWTTGTCASAAAKAATMLLAEGAPPRWVEVALPSGQRVTFAVEESELDGDTARAVVVKDAGDDPDVTDGARLTATVRWRSEPGVGLAAGDGVGTVTKPGLGLEVGGPAINPVPRAMITQAVTEVAGERGIEVVISVPDGERMARKTTNRRLGILGGISILGTTGIVRPFSTASWRASVMQAVQVAAAQGEQTIVLCTGGRTESGAMALLDRLPEVCFIEVGDFTGAALRVAAERAVRDVVFVGMIGKLTKLASGVLMTHYTRSKVDTGLLGEITVSSGGGAMLREQVDAANTARHAYELWDSAGILRAAGDELCARVREVLVRFSRGVLAAEVAMVDFTGKVVVAATKPQWVSWAR